MRADDDLTPNTFQFPSVFVDEALAGLSGPQLKVLVYALRRLFGPERAERTFSMSDLVAGRLDEDGRRLDYGTGLTPDQAWEAVGELLAVGILAGNVLSLSLSVEDTIDWAALAGRSAAALADRGRQTP